LKLPASSAHKAKAEPELIELELELLELLEMLELLELLELL
jgi:hypothetical protein